MKHTYLLILAGIALAMVSCKRDEYKPAPKEEGGQVYFSDQLPAKYNLKDYETNSFSFELNRVDPSADLTVSLGMSGADSIFTVSKEVTFAAGKTVADVTVTWDATKVKEGVDYAISLKIQNDTTTYGDDRYDFTATLEGAWIKWKKGHITEVCWEEEYDATMYYQETSYKNIRYCMIKDAWNDITGEEPVPVGNCYFYWDTVTNDLFIPAQYIGLDAEGSGQIYVSTAAEFYNLYQDWGIVIPSQEYFDWAIQWNAKNGFNNGYYDKKGGFYLGDSMYIVSDGKATGAVWQVGGIQDFFIAEGFTRITDFNDALHYGSSLPLYTGVDTSYFFSKDGGKTPVTFSTFLRYTAPKDSTQETTTYYLGEFFTDTNCLAFTAPVPDLLVNGSSITDVENEQFTGRYSFGEQIWVSVKGGTVIVPTSNEESYPTFKITLKVFTKDAAGNKSHDMGTVTETFVADGILKDHYTIEDVYGGEYDDYIGTWTMKSFDYYDECEYSYDVTISDAGTDVNGVHWYKIANLANKNQRFADTVYSYYNKGVMIVPAQELNGKFNYQSVDYKVQLCIFDPDSEMSYDEYDVLGGICNDGALAFVNRYKGANLCGFEFYLPELERDCALVYYVEEFAAESSSKVSRHTNCYNVNSTPCGGTSINKRSSVLRKVSGKTESADRTRTFTLTPVEKSSRNSLKTLSPTSFCR